MGPLTIAISSVGIRPLIFLMFYLLRLCLCILPNIFDVCEDSVFLRISSHGLCFGQPKRWPLMVVHSFCLRNDLHDFHYTLSTFLPMFRLPCYYRIVAGFHFIALNHLKEHSYTYCATIALPWQPVLYDYILT